MYTLKITDDNEVITTTRETIMQRSDRVDQIQILVEKTYKGMDMSGAEVWMKYVLPMSKELKMKQLILNDGTYKNDYLQYVIPANTMLTAQSGEVKVSFTFIKLDSSGEEPVAYTRKTQEGSIRITPIAEWEDFVPDDLLNPVDQRLIMLQALQKDANALNQELFEKMVNDVRLDEEAGKILLTGKSGDIGTGINTTELSQLLSKDIIGTDLDGVNDGVTHLDGLVNNLKIVNLDQLLE